MDEDTKEVYAMIIWEIFEQVKKKEITEVEGYDQLKEVIDEISDYEDNDDYYIGAGG